MKKLLTTFSIVVLALVCIFALPATAQAATEGDYEYSVSNDEATITGYTGAGGDITIPSTLGGYPVTGLQGYYEGTEYGYFECGGVFGANITSVKIPDSVITIGAAAFAYCDSLKSVTMGKNVTTIAKVAFYSCDGLTSVTIGESVTTISASAFDCCANLKGFCVDQANKNFSSDKRGVLFNKDKTILVQAHYTISESYSIPNSVTIIREGAFKNCDGLTSVTIGDGVESIGNSAFEYCNGLTSVTIPDSVTTIGAGAFHECTELTKVTIGKGLTTIADGVFDGCSGLTGIWASEGNPNFSSDKKGVLFNKDKTTLLLAPQQLSGKYTIPNTVTTIGEGAFSGCIGLTGVTIPDSVTSITDFPFPYDGSLNYTTYGKAKYLGNANNPYLYLAEVTDKEISTFQFLSGTKIIGARVFADCRNLKTFNIADSITSVGKGAFWGCWNLTNVTIGKGVQAIGGNVFGYCEDLTGIWVNKSNAYFSSDNKGVLFNKDKTILLQAPGQLAGSYQIPGSVITIDDDALSRCYNLTGVTIPDSVVTIGNGAFSYCNLVNVTMGKSVVTIGEGAFYSCNFKSIAIPDSVTTIGDSAFSFCNLTSITLGKGVTYVGPLAFTWNDDLKDVYYTGTKTQWEAIDFTYENYPLFRAELHFVQFATITAQPVSAKVGPGQTAKVTVKATGDGLKYQWYYALKGATKWTKTSVTTATFTSGKMSASLNGCRVRCVVTDKYGNSVTSNVATLYMGNAAKITAQPKNIKVGPGQTAKATVKATGDGLKYTWYYAKKGSSKFTKLTTTKATYSVKMTSSVNGRKVYCIITDQYGNQVKTNVVTLYMGNAAKITAQPKSIKVLNGKTAKVTVKATGDGLKYTWYYANKGATKWTKASTTKATYSVKMTSKVNGRRVYCVVKDQYGIEVRSSVVTIKQAPKPKITTQPKSILQVSGKTVKITVKASGEGLKYQWYYAKKGSSSFKKLSGATKATYSVKVSSSVNGRKYFCLVTDKYGQTVKSSAATLTMKTVAKINTQPKSVTVKNGKTAKVTIKAVGDGLKYTWYYLKSGAKEYTKASATSATFSVKMAAAWKNAKVYCVIADKYGNTVKSKVVTMKMK